MNRPRKPLPRGNRPGATRPPTSGGQRPPQPAAGQPPRPPTPGQAQRPPMPQRPQRPGQMPPQQQQMPPQMQGDPNEDGLTTEELAAQAKSRNRMYWTLAIIFSVICLVGVVFIAINGMAAQAEAERKAAEPGAVNAIMNGDFSNAAIAKAEFAKYVTDDLKKALSGLSTVSYDNRDADKSPPVEIGVYVNRVRNEQLLLDNHEFLIELKKEVDRCGQLDSQLTRERWSLESDTKKLLEFVAFFTETRLKLSLAGKINAELNDGDKIESIVEQGLLQDWRQTLSSTMGSKTNVVFTDARSELSGVESSLRADYSEYWKRYNSSRTARSYLNREVSHEEYKSSFGSEDMIIFDNAVSYLKNLREEMTRAFDTANKQYMNFRRGKAEDLYQIDLRLWNAYFEGHNEKIDEFVAKHEVALKAIQSLEAAIGSPNSDVQDLFARKIESFRTKIDGAKKQKDNRSDPNA